MKILSFEEQIELAEKISKVDDFFEYSVTKYFEDYEYIYNKYDLANNVVEAYLTIYDKFGTKYELCREGIKNYSYGNYIGEIFDEWKIA